MKKLKQQEIIEMNDSLVKHGVHLGMFYDEGIRLGRRQVLAMTPVILVGGLLLGGCLSKLAKKGS